MWALALMALSAAAHGQQKPEQQTASAAKQEEAIAKQLSASTKESARTDGAQHRLPETPQATSDDQITLARFIIISIPDRQLALVDNGQVVKTYPIAVGAGRTPSPQGDFKIISRVTNPNWTHKGKVVGPGKDNPVGSRWIGLSLKGYGIHGTNAPRSIGKAASHGCFRMGKKDVEELFKLVRVGDMVTVRGERDELVAQVFGTGNSEVQVASAATPSADAGQD